jgi:hypothetical protein
MKISVKTGEMGAVSADLLAIPVFRPAPKPAGKASKENPRLPTEAAQFDRTLGGIIQRALATGDFRGRPEERLLLYAPGASAKSAGVRVLLVGVGAPGEFGLEGVRRLAGGAASEARERKLGRLTILAPRARGLRAEDCAAALAEGAVLGAYR